MYIVLLARRKDDIIITKYIDLPVNIMKTTFEYNKLHVRVKYNLSLPFLRTGHYILTLHYCFQIYDLIVHSGSVFWV